ncbi:MAG: cell division protein ZapB [Deltaproteobacteria bacterium]|nr:cell division protein ZapB [Deltaproteobacteria bacterium]
MELDKFDILEQRVGRLIESYMLLKQENRKLFKELEEKDKELSKLMEDCGRMDKEKGLIKGKVDSILEKIEGLLQGA